MTSFRCHFGPRLTHFFGILRRLESYICKAPAPMLQRRAVLLLGLLAAPADASYLSEQRDLDRRWAAAARSLTPPQARRKREKRRNPPMSILKIQYPLVIELL